MSPKDAKAHLPGKGAEWRASWEGRSLHCLLMTCSPLGALSSEQAREAAGQLLRWKGDVDQNGYLLLKSAYVLTGTNSVSSRLPRNAAWELLICVPRKAQQRAGVHLRSVFFPHDTDLSSLLP